MNRILLRSGAIVSMDADIDFMLSLLIIRGHTPQVLFRGKSVKRALSRLARD